QSRALGLTPRHQGNLPAAKRFPLPIYGRVAVATIADQQISKKPKVKGRHSQTFGFFIMDAVTRSNLNLLDYSLITRQNLPFL
ncbi:MAG: hypothetical protein ACYSTT_17550, partial [Planctomycetota bacterium]